MRRERSILHGRLGAATGHVFSRPRLSRLVSFAHVLSDRHLDHMPVAGALLHTYFIEMKSGIIIKAPENNGCRVLMAHVSDNE